MPRNKSNRLNNTIEYSGLVSTGTGNLEVKKNSLAANLLNHQNYALGLASSLGTE